MLRRINYTNRQRILQAAARIFITGSPGAYAFDAQFDLSELTLPADAELLVEAYRRMESMRFPFGTVAKPEPPSNRELTLFQDVRHLLFRVKVVGSAHGRLGIVLAEADRIRGAAPDDQSKGTRPLLPVVAKELSGELFRVELEDEPILLVDSRLGGDWQAAVSSTWFQALAFPEALRQVLWMLLKEDSDPDDDAEGWKKNWWTFINALAVGPPPNSEDGGQEDWVDDAVAAFCRKNQLRELFSDAWTRDPRE